MSIDASPQHAAQRSAGAAPAPEVQRTSYRSTRPSALTVPEARQRRLRLPRAKHIAAAFALLFVIALIVLLHLMPEGPSSVSRMTLSVFLLAVWAWVFTSIDDTYVALAAGVALVLLGVASAETFFSTLGDDTVWLLVAAFVIAAGVSASGLATRATAWLVVSASTVRGLVHIVTAAIVVTAFAIPSTSGRAALMVPVFVALATTIGRSGDERSKRVVLILALVFPTVILLSAVASLLGAGAHLITSRVLGTVTGEGFDFVSWMILGLPLAVVSSHLAAEIVLQIFGTREIRRMPVQLKPEDFEQDGSAPVTGPLTVRESRAAMILAVVIVLWCTTPIHDIHPAIVALGGALATTLPRFGPTGLKKTLAKVPWSLLLFMAATLALADSLVDSGAADWIAGAVFGRINTSNSLVFMVAVVVISTLAHLVIQSRSARSAVLIPVVVALAPGIGVDPAAAAFASTAAAGFCHTLTSSAKPVAMFSSLDGVETYSPAHLRRLSIVLGPVMTGLVLAFSYFVWPLLGLPIAR